jgi:hypothetical protein
MGVFRRAAAARMAGRALLGAAKYVVAKGLRDVEGHVGRSIAIKFLWIMPDLCGAARYL